MTLVDEISAAETFRMIPVLQYAQPELRKQQAATNVNLDDVQTFVINGSRLHLLNLQQNYLQSMPGIQEIIAQGPGTAQTGMWYNADIFNLVHVKQLEG